MTVEQQIPEADVHHALYTAHYDSFPLINDAALRDREQVNTNDKRTNQEAFEELFRTIITYNLPQLLKMRAVPTEITAGDVKAWLRTSYMRYHEEPSEIPPEKVGELRNKVARLPGEDVTKPHLDALINTLEMPWGFDEFGRQQILRRIWETQLQNLLKSSGITDAVSNTALNHGGFFALGSSVNQIATATGQLNAVPGTHTRCDEFCGNKATEFTALVEQCATYTERLRLLKEYRMRLLILLEDFIEKQIRKQDEIARQKSILSGKTNP